MPLSYYESTVAARDKSYPDSRVPSPPSLTTTSPSKDPISRPSSSASASKPAKPQGQFVQKLYAMLEAPALASQIAWTQDGSAFCVFDPAELAATVLQRFFKHSNFASLVRQLNIYGFHKVQSTAAIEPASLWEFRHPSFRRGRTDLLSQVVRNVGPTRSNGKDATPSGLVGRGESPSLGKRSLDDDEGGNEDSGSTGSVDSRGPGEGGPDDGRGKRFRRELGGGGGEGRGDEGLDRWGGGGRGKGPGHPLESWTRTTAANPPYGDGAEAPPPPSSVGLTANGPHRSTSATSSSSPSHHLPSDRRPSFTSDGSNGHHHPAPYYHPSVPQRITELQNQVGILSETLAHEQRERARAREVTAGVFGVFFSILSGFDLGPLAQDLHAAHSALANANPSLIRPPSPAYRTHHPQQHSPAPPRSAHSPAPPPRPATAPVHLRPEPEWKKEIAPNGRPLLPPISALLEVKGWREGCPRRWTKGRSGWVCEGGRGEGGRTSPF